MPVPGYVLRIMGDLDRAGAWVVFGDNGVRIWQRDQLSRDLRHDLDAEREDFRAYVEMVWRQRIVEVPWNCRWPRCWWKPVSQWAAELKKDDALRGERPPPWWS